MSFLKLHHRKLLDKLEEDSDKICSPYCSPSNDSGLCIPDCWSVCPEYCRSYLPPDTIITPPISSSLDGHHDPIIPHKFLIIIISLIVATFLALCCYVYYFKYYVPRRRRLLLSQQHRNETHDDFLDEDHGPVLDHPIWYIHTIGLHPAIINAIAVCKYKKGEGIVEGTDCSVCLSEFEEDETLRLLPKCSHAFHISCIDTWLRSHTNCPMCRAPIVKNPSFAAFSAASSSSEESSSNNLSTNVDTQVIDLQVNGENEREVGHEVHERIITATDEENDVEIEYRMKINESGDEDADGELQPMRRSVSLDYVSAPKINQSTANTEIQEDNVGSSECQSASEVDTRLGVVPKRDMPVSTMIRSFSCSGKFLLSKRSW